VIILFDLNEKEICVTALRTFHLHCSGEGVREGRGISEQDGGGVFGLRWLICIVAFAYAIHYFLNNLDHLLFKREQ